LIEQIDNFIKNIDDNSKISLTTDTFTYSHTRIKSSTDEYIELEEGCKFSNHKPDLIEDFSNAIINKSDIISINDIFEPKYEEF